VVFRSDCDLIIAGMKKTACRTLQPADNPKKGTRFCFTQRNDPCASVAAVTFLHWNADAEHGVPETMTNWEQHMTAPQFHVDFEFLEKFMTDAFVKLGMSAEAAAITADVLIAADKQGIDSHGIGRFKPVYVDRIQRGQVDPKARPEIVREGPTTAVIDGHNGMGQPVSKFAMETALQKARAFGMGMTAVRNSNHYGIAGYYAAMAASAGMVGITGTNARPSVAPTFGSEPMLGTNPLAFGMPTDEAFPFVLDCATSASQRGKIEVSARLGRPVPDGWAVGRSGEPVNDAMRILADLEKGAASLVPLGGAREITGGHKGYGYATAVEILSSALAGGAFLHGLSGLDASGAVRPLGIGHFFIAVDVSAFAEPEAFRKSTGDILRALRASAKAPGHDRIYTAGEKEYLVWQARKDKGAPVDEALRRDLLAVRDDLGMTQVRFPFER
jgi:L-2-hydroxycarboxylate dehydrogenase (NAD+)